MVWSYIRENNIPYNKLHDVGYPSIGSRTLQSSQYRRRVLDQEDGGGKRRGT